MAAPQIFKVLTEFKFETGQAIVSSGKLQQSVDQISNSADSALFSLKRLGLGLVADFGVGASSLLGVLGQALKSSESFTQNQLSFSNLLSANLQNLTGDVGTFNDRMMVSKSILKDIAKDAAKFGLDEKALAGTTKLLGGFLLPKGLAGQNMGEARDLSRNFMKSSPTLGVDSGEAQGQLLRMIEGSASLGDTLFRRLSAETQAFQDKLKGTEHAAKAFNNLPLRERFELIKKGMGQFASDMDVLAGQANTFNNLFQRLKDTFGGLNGILLPLGDILAGPIKDAFNKFLKILDTDARKIIEQVSQLLKPFVSDLQGLVVNLLQLRELGSDLRKASFVTSLIGGFLMLLPLLSKFGLTLGVIGRGLMTGVTFAFTALSKVFMFMMPVISFLVSSVVKFLPILAALTFLFQLISRAVAIAKVHDALAIPKLMGELAEIMNRFRAILEIVAAPFIQLFNTMAEGISPLFRMSNLFEFLIFVLTKVADTITQVFGSIFGIMFAVLQIVDNLKAGKFTSAFDGVGKAFDAGMMDFFEQVNRATKDPEGGTSVASNITNINKVEIKNDFKEQFEPDRIAFSIKDQLLKAAQNPTGARNKGFALTGSR